MVKIGDSPSLDDALKMYTEAKHLWDSNHTVISLRRGTMTCKLINHNLLVFSITYPDGPGNQYEMEKEFFRVPADWPLLHAPS